jgi:hypothetical protein
MAITNAGLAAIADAIAGTGTLFDNANAYIGVGNGTTAFANTQTDLQGTSKVRSAVDDGYPTVSGAAITYRATFSESQANFAWQEWGIFNASTGGDMLNRVVENNSTKLNTQVWVLEVTLTLSAS